jgi:C1A family cysteine protease
MQSRRRFIKSLLATYVTARAGQATPQAADPSFGSSPSSRRSYNGFYFGWIRDLPTLAVQKYVAPLGIKGALPEKVDLRGTMPPVYTQGELGSCTANAIAAVVQYVRRRDGRTPDFTPSRLFIYYNGRVIENSVATDSGLQIRDGIRVVETLGVCPEQQWPYDATKADPDDGKFPKDSRAVVKPPAVIYKDAYPYRTVVANSVEPRIDQLRGCLAEEYPFIFGFTVYPSFFDSSGRPRTDIPLPATLDIPKSGHAAVAVGYDNRSRTFICRNSWGERDATGQEVHDGGHFYLPYDYLTNEGLVADIWMIRSVFGNPK